MGYPRVILRVLLPQRIIARRIFQGAGLPALKTTTWPVASLGRVEAWIAEFVGNGKVGGIKYVLR